MISCHSRFDLKYIVLFCAHNGDDDDDNDDDDNDHSCSARSL